MNVPTPKVGPELKSVSPTQAKEFVLCPRKHWLNKRAKIPQPKGDFLYIGDGLHAAQETYFETGNLYDPQSFSSTYEIKDELRESLRTALESGRQLLADEDAPRFKPGLLIETPRNYQTGLKISGVPLWQRSDLLDPTNKSVAYSYDWKSSGNVFGDFTKTAEQLRTDEQGVLYAFEAFVRFKPAAVVFTHGVCGTKAVEYDLISTEPMTKEHVDSEVKKIEETVRQMREHFAINDFVKTKPGAGGPSASWGSPCRAYGGCPYAVHCGVELPAKKEAKETAVPDEKPLSLKERLAKAKLATGINPSDAAPPAPVTPYVPTATAAPAAGATTSSVDLNALLGELDSLVARIKAAVVEAARLT